MLVWVKYVYNNYLNNNMIQYVVKKNDSLYMIAKKYNVSVEDLKHVNHLVSNMIYPNQILFIPNTYINNCDVLDNFKNKYTNDYNKTFVSRVHIVDSNDKIEDILAKYNLSPLEFLKLNENIILINGKEIIISK